MPSEKYRVKCVTCKPPWTSYRTSKTIGKPCPNGHAIFYSPPSTRNRAKAKPVAKATCLQCFQLIDTELVTSFLNGSDPDGEVYQHQCGRVLATKGWKP